MNYEARCASGIFWGKFSLCQVMYKNLRNLRASVAKWHNNNRRTVFFLKAQRRQNLEKDFSLLSCSCLGHLLGKGALLSLPKRPLRQISASFSKEVCQLTFMAAYCQTLIWLYYTSTILLPEYIRKRKSRIFLLFKSGTAIAKGRKEQKWK